MTRQQRDYDAGYIQRTRRHPRPTQFDYLHLRYLVDHLAEALGSVPGPVHDVLDLYCGARPYDSLLPADARRVGFDIRDDYGLADVVSDEFLPFPDSSFDLILCTEAFYYVRDPVHGVSEIGRVLRPGGTVVMTVPLVWQYNPAIFERRFSGPELADLFAGWDDVAVVPNGGRAVAWTYLSGHMVDMVEQALRRRSRAAVVLRPLFIAWYLAINVLGGAVARLESRRSPLAATLPMGLLVRARRPTR
jgi:SAM-dependent methyltransferase